MKKPLLVFFFCLLLLILMGIGYLGIVFYKYPLSAQQGPIHIVIKKGEDVKAIAQAIQNQGAYKWIYYGMLGVKWSGQINKIKAGEYLISPQTTFVQLLEKLIQGQVVLHKITFPEGITFKQMLAVLAAEPALSHTLGEYADKEIMSIIGHPDEYPEGLFFPDTYLFTLGTKDTTLLKLSYTLMQKKLQQAWRNRASELPYQNAYQALIVASLVEREAKIDKERPLIADVILRRLAIGMPLQIDASVLYGLNGKHQRTLTRMDLNTDTVYNTYTRKGLPPTPIAMPGMASIQAALHPISSKALYYVAKGDGSHFFSETLQEHHAAVAIYRKGEERNKATTILQCVAPGLMLQMWKSLIPLA